MNSENVTRYIYYSNKQILTSFNMKSIFFLQKDKKRVRGNTIINTNNVIINKRQHYNYFYYVNISYKFSRHMLPFLYKVNGDSYN
jgi:hypothetical protein